jgi:pyrimidine operon attenuation protein/uracil phosphoribosyltransferase
VERTHKKFPIDVNYVGLSIATAKNENIVVDVKDGEVMGAYIETV